jgi:Ca2+-transporting ATPase
MHSGSIEALKRIARVTTKVQRAGGVRELPALALVPGDVVLLEAGEGVTADLRLVEASNCRWTLKGARF